MSEAISCANCGAEIPRGAKACPACGADERTGWRETSVYDGIELPDENTRESVARRKATDFDRSVGGVPWFWWCAGIVVLTVLIFGALALL